MALGKTSIINGDESVEDRINGLARALGIPSKELASAVASAVRQYVPPKETGKLVESLLKVEEMPGVVEQVISFGSGLDAELE